LGRRKRERGVKKRRNSKICSEKEKKRKVRRKKEGQGGKGNNSKTDPFILYKGARLLVRCGVGRSITKIKNQTK
jgi:hypothetical protein